MIALEGGQVYRFTVPGRPVLPAEVKQLARDRNKVLSLVEKIGRTILE